MTAPTAPTAERIKAAKVFFEEQLKDRIAYDKKVAALDDPFGLVHPLYIGKRDEPYYRIILALLDEKAAQLATPKDTKAGATIRTRQEQLIGELDEVIEILERPWEAPSPGLSDDERALADIAKVSYGVGYDYQHRLQVALAHLRSRLSKPAPPITDWKDGKCPCREELPIAVHVDADLSCTEQEKWKTVGIDKCIAPIVQALQSAGINMRGSCCGHGGVGDIALSDGRMLKICHDRASFDKPAPISEEAQSLMDTTAGGRATADLVSVPAPQPGQSVGQEEKEK